MTNPGLHHLTHPPLRLTPDPAGRFGFNVRGGADQRMPVLVSKVARSTPAAAAVPSLEEGKYQTHLNTDTHTQTHTHTGTHVRYTTHT